MNFITELINLGINHVQEVVLAIVDGFRFY